MRGYTISSGRSMRQFLIGPNEETRCRGGIHRARANPPGQSIAHGEMTIAAGVLGGTVRGTEENLIGVPASISIIQAAAN